MKKIFTIITLVIISLSATAEKQKIAVYFTGSESEKKIALALEDPLISAFRESGKYIPVERQTDFIEAIYGEHGFQESGEVAEKDIIGIGDQFGAQVVCVIRISTSNNEKYISARILDVKTGEILQNTPNVYSTLDSKEELQNAAKRITEVLTAETDKEKAEKAKEYANIDLELRETLDKGYIKLDHIYATIAYGADSYDAAKKAASACRIGGMSGWKLPSVAEMEAVVRAIRIYQKEKNLYPKSASRLEAINTECMFWTSDGQAGEPGGDRYRYGTGMGYVYRAYIMLIHDTPKPDSLIQAEAEAKAKEAKAKEEAEAKAKAKADSIQQIEDAARALVEEKIYEEPAKMLSMASITGYMRIENIYVMTTTSIMKWDQAKKVAKEARLGGLTWRLPTFSELQMIRQKCTTYSTYFSKNKGKYLYISEDLINHLSSIVEGDKEYLTATKSYVSEGTRYKHDSSNYGYLLLVSDGPNNTK